MIIKNKKIFIIIALIATLFVSLVFHRRVNDFFDVFLLYMPYEAFNAGTFWVELAISLALLGVASVFIFRSKDPLFWGANFSFWFLLMALTYYYLFVSSIEWVHFPQYALITVLFYLLIKNHLTAMILAVMFGVIDEAFQFVVLYADRKDLYLDYNDMFMNVIGSALGILIILFCERKTDKLNAVEKSH